MKIAYPLLCGICLATVASAATNSAANLLNIEHHIEDACHDAYDQSGGVTVSMRNAAGTCYELWDRELNSSYRRLLKSVSKPEILRTAERAWLGWETTNTAAQNAVLSTDPGTLALIVADSEGTDFVSGRVLDLHYYERLSNSTDSPYSDASYRFEDVDPLDQSLQQAMAAASNDPKKLLELSQEYELKWNSALDTAYSDLLNNQDLSDEQKAAVRKNEEIWAMWRDKEHALQQMLLLQVANEEKRTLFSSQFHLLIIRSQTLFLRNQSKLLEHPP